MHSFVCVCVYAHVRAHVCVCVCSLFHSCLRHCQLVQYNTIYFLGIIKHTFSIQHNIITCLFHTHRSSQTGEGHYFFTGQHASRLFTTMRRMMTNKSASSSPSLPTPSPSQNPRRSSEPQSSPLLHSMQVNPMYPRIERIGVEPQSEDDWTGDSWTGTSDSGFFPRSSEAHNHFLLPAGPAPPLPPDREPRQDTSHYMHLNVTALDKDNDYVQIRKQEHVYDQVPTENGSSTPTISRPHYQVPRPHVNTTTSQNGSSRLSITDDYCQMNSVAIAREIKRNGSLPMARPPPVPPHQKGVAPPKPWADTHSGTRANRY